jgi:hypothetical protein
VKITTKHLYQGETPHVVIGGGKVYLSKFRLDLPLQDFTDPLAEVQKLFEAKVAEAADLLIKNRPEITLDELEGVILYTIAPTSIHSGNKLHPNLYYAVGSVVVDVAGSISLAHLQ